MKKPNDDVGPVPRIAQAVKEMNGKSTHKLLQSIDALDELLDKDRGSDARDKNSDSVDRDTGTE